MQSVSCIKKKVWIKTFYKIQIADRNTDEIQTQIKTNTLLSNFTILWANLADDKLVIFFSFFFFSRKTEFDMSCKLSPFETVCMKRLILFFGKNKKNISKCRLLKILPRVLNLRVTITRQCIQEVFFISLFQLPDTLSMRMNEKSWIICLAKLKCSETVVGVSGKYYIYAFSISGYIFAEFVQRIVNGIFASNIYI